MARLTKESNKRIWVASRHSINDTLSVIGFADTMEATDGLKFNVVETAEQKATAFVGGHGGSRIMEGATTAEQAIEAARIQHI